MTNREKLLDLLDRCLPESDETELNCGGCAYSADCHSGASVSLPARWVEDVRKFLKSEKPRLLTLEEIKALPDYTIVYEEHRFDWSDCPVEQFREDKIDIEMAPVEKVGDRLSSITGYDVIDDRLFVQGETDRVRVWLGRPTDEQREAEPWE